MSTYSIIVLIGRHKMQKEEIVVLILDKLELFYEDQIRVSRKSLPRMTCGTFIELILEGYSGPEISRIWGVGEQTFNRTVSDKLTPKIGKCNGGGETLGFLLMAYVGYKKCRGCDTLLPYSEYHKDSTLKQGIAHICKMCRSVSNKEQYGSAKTKLAHEESYNRNKHKITERNIYSKYKRSLRIPTWSEQEQIQQFYKLCPTGYHVDHILPLQGTYVSGLHVLGNLQYLPEKDNLVKGNKFTPE